MSDEKNHVAAVYRILQNDTSVTALVGTNIFPNSLPQNRAYPAIVYSQLNEDYLPCKDTLITNGYLFTLEIYSPINAEAGGYPLAKSIAAACKVKLKFYRGTVNNSTYSIRLENETDAPVEESPEAFKIVQEYRLRVL